MADISKITIPDGNSTTTYNLKDNAALHEITPSTKTIIPITGLETYSSTTLGSNELTSLGTVTIDSTTVTNYKLNLTGVINSLTATGQTAATISGLTSSGQTVVTGITAS